MEDKLKLDRFMLRIPDEVVDDFVRDMDLQVRTAQELAAFLIVMHYRRERMIRAKSVAEREKAESIADIPVFGAEPKHTSNEGEVKHQNGE